MEHGEKVQNDSRGIFCVDAKEDLFLKFETLKKIWMLEFMIGKLFSRKDFNSGKSCQIHVPKDHVQTSKSICT
jgi:hypothetical protein